jgi:hypothetical protein
MLEWRPPALTNTPLSHAHTASPRPLARTHDTNTKRNRNQFPDWGSPASINSPQSPIMSIDIPPAPDISSLFQDLICLTLFDGYYNFGAQNMSFGMPAASTLTSWVNMGRSRSTWEHKKGDRGVQALIFIDFGSILGPHLESVAPWTKIGVFCSRLLPGHIF